MFAANRGRAGVSALWALALMSGAWAEQSLAAPPAMPTDEQIRAKMAEGKAITQEALEQAAPGMGAGTVMTGPTEPQAGIDLEAIAKKYEEMRAPSAQEQGGPRVYVFVSRTVPANSLDRILADAARAGATVVWRGLVGSNMKETFRELRRMGEVHQASMQLDPTKFRNYGITAVPTTVLAIGADPKCSSGRCTDPGEYYAVSGDVSLEYALEEIARHRPAAREPSAPFLARLRGGQ